MRVVRVVRTFGIAVETRTWVLQSASGKKGGDTVMEPIVGSGETVDAVIKAFLAEQAADKHIREAVWDMCRMMMGHLFWWGFAVGVLVGGIAGGLVAWAWR